MIFKQGKKCKNVKRSTLFVRENKLTLQDNFLSIPVKISIFLVICIWCAGIFIEFFIPFKSSLAVTIPFLNIAYSNVCHQIAAREISDGKLHSLVCARCSGIYLGALLGSFFILFKRSINLSPFLNKLLILTIFPILADVILYNIGVYDYSKNAAFITGLLSGSAGFLYILDAFQKFINEYKRKKVL